MLKAYTKVPHAVLKTTDFNSIYLCLLKVQFQFFSFLNNTRAASQTSKDSFSLLCSPYESSQTLFESGKRQNLLQCPGKQ